MSSKLIKKEKMCMTLLNIAYGSKVSRKNFFIIWIGKLVSDLDIELCWLKSKVLLCCKTFLKGYSGNCVSIFDWSIYHSKFQFFIICHGFIDNCRHNVSVDWRWWLVSGPLRDWPQYCLPLAQSLSLLPRLSLLWQQIAFVIECLGFIVFLVNSI